MAQILWSYLESKRLSNWVVASAVAGRQMTSFARWRREMSVQPPVPPLRQLISPYFHAERFDGLNNFFRSHSVSLWENGADAIQREPDRFGGPPGTRPVIKTCSQWPAFVRRPPALLDGSDQDSYFVSQSKQMSSANGRTRGLSFGSLYSPGKRCRVARTYCHYSQGSRFWGPAKAAAKRSSHR